ncbi:MAG TPA: response regulator transcription factor [Burkholderiaceae bacterium]|nr:response regulator transcription factor [Burkholderiaceae bacterium]
MTNDSDARPRTALFVDDHGLVRASFVALLKTVAPDLSIRTASSLAEALRLLAERADDFVFIDLALSDARGLTALLDIHRRAQQSVLVVVSGDDSSERIRECAQAGARGFLPKSMPVEELTEAVRCVLREGTWFPLAAMLERGRPNYSPRAIEILSLVAQGLTDKQIGKQLGLSSTTVKWYVREAGTKLGVRKRTAMVTVAREIGLI